MFILTEQQQWFGERYHTLLHVTTVMEMADLKKNTGKRAVVMTCDSSSD